MTMNSARLSTPFKKIESQSIQETTTDMDLSLTLEQKALRQTARDFVDKHILPIALERDRIPDPA